MTIGKYYRLEEEQGRRQDKVTATLLEIERLSEKVDSEGWNSIAGRSLLNMMVTILSGLLADVDMLKVKAERFET